MNYQDLFTHPCEVYDMAFEGFLAAAERLEQAAPDPDILRHLTAIRAFAQIMDYSMRRTCDYRSWSRLKQDGENNAEP